MTVDTDRILKRLDDIRSREEAEFRKLCQEPDNFKLAQLLVDRLWGNLARLCNYDHVVNGIGGTTDIMDVIRDLQDDVCSEFYKLTGKQYLPDVVRQKLFDQECKKGGV